VPEKDPQNVLRRVLLLERQQGFKDRAAVGGLAEFAKQQLERADTEERLRLLPAATLLEEYGRADRQQREKLVSVTLQSLPAGAPVDAGPQPQRADPSFAAGSVAQRHDAVAPPALAKRADEVPQPAIVREPAELEKPVSSLPRVGKAMAENLNKVGVFTIGDLLRYFPRTHYDYTDTRSISRMRLGQKTTLVGTIIEVRSRRTRRGATITTAMIGDDSRRVAVRWFNQAYLQQKLPRGSRVAISGEAGIYDGQMVFQPRDFELIETEDLIHTRRLVPIYPLTRGLFQRSLRQLIRRVVEEYAGAVEEFLPANMVAELRFPELSRAILSFHFPLDEEDRARAERRLAFDELLLIQLGLLMRKLDWQRPVPEAAIAIDQTLHARYERSLPFDLTGAQRSAVAEIFSDMARPVPMSRLLEGDVGSGKTVVAAAALLQTVRAGKQGVLMAPTEILAEQHATTLRSLLEPFDVRCELLIGSTPLAGKKRLYESARIGEIDVLIGTHALIQEGLALADLGLAVTDEQHRFGVEQRSTLREKGLHPHILAMTATPIPRTLAMTIYGDLDVSIIAEMPPGRLAPITTWAGTPAEAYRVVRDEVRKGRQAFIVCPVIEESADTDMRSAIAEHKQLSTLTFPDLSVGLLHGRMKSKEKDATLAAFRRAEYQVLVATSVVEVGIDIPNATVMVVQDAHRFGLAQLHQFRGRVGRGGDQAYCVLLSSAEAEEARERLEAVTATENGFELAEEDLRLRGPGEFWGTRQSGLPELRVAQLGDLPTIQLARQAAIDLLARDPELAAPDHAAIRDQVRRFWSERVDLS
jgi:ATP-dependent DNA helicase RecG